MDIPIVGTAKCPCGNPHPMSRLYPMEDEFAIERALLPKCNKGLLDDVELGLTQAAVAFTFAHDSAKQPDLVPNWDMLMHLWYESMRRKPPHSTISTRLAKDKKDVHVPRCAREPITEPLGNPSDAITEPIEFLNQPAIKTAIRHGLVRANRFRCRKIILECVIPRYDPLPHIFENRTPTPPGDAFAIDDEVTFVLCELYAEMRPLARYRSNEEIKRRAEELAIIEVRNNVHGLSESELLKRRYELLPESVGHALGFAESFLNSAFHTAAQPHWIPSYDTLWTLWKQHKNSKPPRIYEMDGTSGFFKKYRFDPDDQITTIDDPVAFLNQPVLKKAIELNLVAINMCCFRDFQRKYKLDQQSVSWTSPSWIRDQTKIYWRAAKVNSKKTLGRLGTKKHGLCFFLYIFVVYLVYTYNW